MTGELTEEEEEELAFRAVEKIKTSKTAYIKTIKQLQQELAEANEKLKDVIPKSKVQTLYDKWKKGKECVFQSEIFKELLSGKGEK